MSELQFRPATRDDIVAIVALLVDDELGAKREDPSDLAPYRTAFEAIESNPMHELIVATKDGVVVGCCQITILHNLSRRGSTRALLEAVRVAGTMRGQKVGEQLVHYAIARAKARGAVLLQLTSDKRRDKAIRFYERLGFVASHEGMKLVL
ncbi:GNAT family N-acetyltransferase [Roseiterribacter gracilis]|uniref:GNAT family acetyltransferase n=1 Tax=Roseiterribacter gracilis TaxID=2812848 RepID=A0A8S8XAG6_9PROT|nr:GNAT family acetyltransferase [Rhodospirillales bacterium TMPK1]